MKTIRGFMPIVSLFAVSLMASSPTYAQGTDTMKPMKSMKMGGMKMGGMKMVTGAPVVPAVTGFSEGKTILFIHTETSDAGIAKLLTDMMGGSPVLHVPALAKIPSTSLARVYVFKNGSRGANMDSPKGPFGFQPDVFENPPGSPGYSPLRKVVLVTWKQGETGTPFLMSSAQVRQAAADGKLTLEETGIVVNMPMLTWPGGKR